jgi:hypothetical protein
MPNYIVYHVSSVEETHECAYSLLKCLDLYNLKPPADLAVAIYTGQPALLESFGSYFNSFELLNKTGNETKYALIRKFCARHSGNVLYLDTNVYPVRTLEGLFSDLARGNVYAVPGPGKTPHGQQKDFAVLGFSSQTERALDAAFMQGNTRNAENFITRYGDLKEFRLLLKDFFSRYHEESIPNQVKLIHAIDAKQIEDQKKRFRKLPFYQRLLRKMTGKAWDISDYAVKI